MFFRFCEVRKLFLKKHHKANSGFFPLGAKPKSHIAYGQGQTICYQVLDMSGQVCKTLALHNKAYLQGKNSAVSGEFPMGSKFHFSRCETYLSKYINKSLKFEEIEYIIYYIKFIMQQALFYVKFVFYPNSSMDCKLRFFNVGIRKYLNFFRNLKRD